MGLPPASRIRNRELPASSAGRERSWLWIKRSSCRPAQPLQAKGRRVRGGGGQLPCLPAASREKQHQEATMIAAVAPAPAPAPATDAVSHLSAAPSSASWLWLIDSFSSLAQVATQLPRLVMALWESTSVLRSLHLSKPARQAGRQTIWWWPVQAGRWPMQAGRARNHQQPDHIKPRLIRRGGAATATAKARPGTHLPPA